MDDSKDNQGTVDQGGAIQQHNDPGTATKESPKKNIDSGDRESSEECSMVPMEKRNEVKKQYSSSRLSLSFYAVQ